MGQNSPMPEPRELTEKKRGAQGEREEHEGDAGAHTAAASGAAGAEALDERLLLALHAAVAQSLLLLFGLDEVIFVPAFVAPHKRDRKVSPALDRPHQLSHAAVRHRRNLEEVAPVLPRTFAQAFETFGLVERVYLRRDDELRALGEPRVVGRKLAVDYLVVRHGVAPRQGRNVNEV